MSPLCRIALKLFSFLLKRINSELFKANITNELFNPIQARRIFRDPQRFLSITLRAFEIIL